MKSKQTQDIEMDIARTCTPHIIGNVIESRGRTQTLFAVGAS